MKFLQWEKDELKFKREKVLLFIEGILCVILLVSLCFNNNVWWDEASTIDLVINNTWKEILLYTAKDVHPPLYYFAAKAAVIIFGNSLFVIKMVSVFANIAMIVLGITKIYKRFGLKAASLFIFLSCFAPQMAVHGVMVRMYSWATFFILASAVYGYEALCDNRKSDWILFVLFSLGGVYTLYFACISISCIYLLVLIEIAVRQRKLLKRFWYAALGTTAGYLPWLYIFFRMTLVGLGGNQENTEGETIGILFRDFWRWAFDCNIKGDTLIYGGLVLLALFGVLLYNRKKQGKTGFEFFFVLMLCATPFYTIILGTIMNHMAGRMLLNRYIEPSLILVWLACAIGLSRYKNRLYYMAFACLILLGVENYRFVYHDEYDIAPLIHETEDFIETQMEPGDVVAYELEPYEVMYAYYMPQQELVYYKDLDLKEYLGKSFWYIDAWGGYFDAETVEDYQLQKEECGNFGIQSMDFKIYRITVNGDGK